MKKADKAFSDFVRERDKWTCQRCGTIKDKTDPYQRMGLHCSHYHKRGNKSTRYEEDNCVSLCYACHRLWESDKQGEYKEFMINRIGQEAFDALAKKTNTMQKMGKADYQNVFEYYQEELRRLEKGIVPCPYCQKECKGDRGVSAHLDKGDCL